MMVEFEKKISKISEVDRAVKIPRRLIRRGVVDPLVQYKVKIETLDEWALSCVEFAVFPAAQSKESLDYHFKIPRRYNDEVIIGQKYVINVEVL